mgnify:CR=1 FL=1
MDGRQANVTTSLQRKLSIWMSATIVCLAVVAGFVSYYSAFHEAHEFQDDVLERVAESFGRYKSSDLSVFSDKRRNRKFGQASELVIESLTPPVPGQVDEPASRFKLPYTTADGLRTMTILRKSWRVLVYTSESGDRLVVAQPTNLRNDIARSSGLTAIIPLLVLIPLLLVILTLIIRMMFRPVNQLADEMDHKTYTTLEPISVAGVPKELLPFVRSTNLLLERVSEAMTQQRRFIADAAHELRSPLTALSLYIQRLEMNRSSALFPAEDFQSLKMGVQRLNDLVAQLLSMARSQGASLEKAPALAVTEVIYQVLEELAPLADAKAIDLGLIKNETFYIAADRIELFTAIRNVVDNAIRYSASGSKVDIAAYVQNGKAIIEVSDNGPGIAKEYRDRVFDPFYRVLGTRQQGSGLGLSIVKSAVEKMGGSVTLGYADETAQKGLKVTLAFTCA